MSSRSLCHRLLPSYLEGSFYTYLIYPVNKSRLNKFDAISNNHSRDLTLKYEAMSIISHLHDFPIEKTNMQLSAFYMFLHAMEKISVNRKYKNIKVSKKCAYQMTCQSSSISNDVEQNPYLRVETPFLFFTTFRHSAQQK